MGKYSQIQRRCTILLVFFFFGEKFVYADDLSDVLQGFDIPETENRKISDVPDGVEASGDKPAMEVLNDDSSDLFYFSGSTGISGAADLKSHRRPPETNNRQGPAKLRGELDLKADLFLGGSWKARVTGQGFYDTAYSIRGRENYTSQTLGEYEDEVELGEVWLQGSPLPGLDLKIGRQIVVWGKSDNIRVTDILNPMDKREPGMTDIEDLRLPVAMSRLDYTLAGWTVTGIVVHETRFDKLPTYGSDYYTSSQMMPKEDKPVFFFENQEIAFALNGTFSGWGIAFYAAHLFDDSAHIESAGDNIYKRVHSRITMLGMAVNAVQGDWLWKAETACLTGLEFAALPGDDKTRLDMLLGVEYSGLTDTTVSLEVADRHLFGFEEGMKISPDSAEENDIQWAFRLCRDFMHERLETMFLAQLYGPLGQGGAVERLEFSYDMTDDWEGTLGLVLYQPGDDVSLYDLDECNRLFFRIKYSF